MIIPPGLARRCAALARPARIPDAQAPVSQRHAAADEHDDGAQPDQRDVGLPVEPHVERAVAVLLGNDDVHLPELDRAQARFRGGHGAMRVELARRIELADDHAAFADGHVRRGFGVIGPLAALDVVERHDVGPEVRRCRRASCRDALDAPAGRREAEAASRRRPRARARCPIATAAGRWRGATSRRVEPARGRRGSSTSMKAPTMT